MRNEVSSSFSGRRRQMWAVASLISLIGCSSPSPLPVNELLNYRVPARQLVDGPVDRSQLSLLVEKSRFKMTLKYGGKPLKEYPIVLGADPVGDKRYEGDRRTPEGQFKIRDLYPHRSWGFFLWLDYPTADSYRKYREAKRLGAVPSNRGVGGEIGIHGVPAGQDRRIDDRVNWTHGCVSLKSGDIAELYSLVRRGVIVEIRQ